MTASEYKTFSARARSWARRSDRAWLNFVKSLRGRIPVMAERHPGLLDEYLKVVDQCMKSLRN